MDTLINLFNWWLPFLLGFLLGSTLATAKLLFPQDQS